MQIAGHPHIWQHPSGYCNSSMVDGRTMSRKGTLIQSNTIKDRTCSWLSNLQDGGGKRVSASIASVDCWEELKILMTLVNIDECLTEYPVIIPKSERSNNVLDLSLLSNLVPLSRCVHTTFDNQGILNDRWALLAQSKTRLVHFWEKMPLFLKRTGLILESVLTPTPQRQAWTNN